MLKTLKKKLKEKRIDFQKINKTFNKIKTQLIKILPRKFQK